MSRDLSAREAQVLELVALGLCDKQIARELQVTANTVRYHCARIYSKIGVANRTQAALHHVTGGKHAQ